MFYSLLVRIALLLAGDARRSFDLAALKTVFPQWETSQAISQ